MQGLEQGRTHSRRDPFGQQTTWLGVPLSERLGSLVQKRRSQWLALNKLYPLNGEDLIKRCLTLSNFYSHSLPLGTGSSTRSIAITICRGSGQAERKMMGPFVLRAPKDQRKLSKKQG